MSGREGHYLGGTGGEDGDGRRGARLAGAGLAPRGQWGQWRDQWLQMLTGRGQVALRELPLAHSHEITRF